MVTDVAGPSPAVLVGRSPSPEQAVMSTARSTTTDKNTVRITTSDLPLVAGHPSAAKATLSFGRRARNGSIDSPTTTVWFRNAAPGGGQRIVASPVIPRLRFYPVGLPLRPNARSLLR